MNFAMSKIASTHSNPSFAVTMLFVVFLVAAFIGAVTSECDCLKKELMKCSTEQLKTFKMIGFPIEWDNYCQVLTKGNECEREAKQKCGINEEIMNTDDLADAYLKSACDPDTDLYSNISGIVECIGNVSADPLKKCSSKEKDKEILYALQPVAERTFGKVSIACLEFLLQDACKMAKIAEKCGDNAKGFHQYIVINDSERLQMCPASLQNKLPEITTVVELLIKFTSD